ncbi:MAG: zinc ribbon domain-containing protein [Solobacterium sp.]|nr:zinc ribbon domain-containing protein [Solobacterium sp.]
METTRTYILPYDSSAQSVAYALAEYLDVEKNMITQTMRTRNGYTVQCKGDATAEWTKYIGMDAALSIAMTQIDDELTVVIGTDKWMEKLGIAAVGSIFFQPLLITAGIGALRQATLPQDIFRFIEDFLGVEPVEKTVPERSEPVAEKPEVMLCPNCGAANKIGSHFCRECSEKLIKPVVKCPECDAELEGDETFCPFCGKRLK